MKKLALVLILSLAVSTTAVIANASTRQNNELTITMRGFKSTMKTSAYIYEWPSIYGHIIGYVPSGATINNTGDVTNNMVKITYKGVTGYVPVDSIDAKG